jgi:hypothetical protein
MLQPRLLLSGLVLALICTLGPGTALAAVKCTCNNGRTINTMRDGEDACNDACQIHGGGGRVWSPNVDDDDDDVTVRRGPKKRPDRPASPRR